MQNGFVFDGRCSNDDCRLQTCLLVELPTQIWDIPVIGEPDIEVGWDGTFNGRVQVSDVYVYQIIVIGEDGEEVREQGYIYLTK